MKKLLVLVLSIVTLNQTLAQETKSAPKTPIGGRPSIPSDLNFEFGFNQLTNRPADLGMNFFGSRTFNISYQFPILLAGDHSGFTLNPGFGIGSDKILFADSKNLFLDPDLGANSAELLKVTDVYGTAIDLKKNNFTANYFEIPLEVRYHFNKDNYNKSFRVSIGGKFGMLYEAHTKIKYESASKGSQKMKHSQEYGLEKFRYALTFKAGSPGFYVWSNFYLNDMWEKGRGPFATQASQVNFGIALTVF
ncbi:outer membrane beta-barrel protein [Algoriphagus mannitolivorans]|uniref:outer membrane beta-barrel protein n=1 Tax=Algoriphagus mannitolivorans TaxID=226504 RepID=UPI000428DCC3|nr:outer membrane beta-barrel protein [Algoriphagus mannitolivorans]